MIDDLEQGLIDPHTMTAVQYEWMLDILKRIRDVIEGEDTDEAKMKQIAYLTKMGLKAELNDD